MAPIPVKRFGLLFVAACLATCPAPVRADHIRLIGGQTYPVVTVTDVTDGQVVFRTDAGRELRKPLAQIEYVELTGLPSLDTAERLASGGEYRQAAAGYERLLAEAGTTWRKRLILSRLLKAYHGEGRFDKAVEKYVELVQDMGPAVRDLAPGNFPVPGSRFYEVALGTIERAAVANHLKDETRACLREFAEVVRRAQAGAAAQPPTPEEPPDESPPPEPDSVADDSTLLSQARRAFEAGEFATAIRLCDQALERGGQGVRAESVYIKGSAEIRLADSSADRLTAGLTLMRVVAIDGDGAFAAAALYQVGLLYEQLGRRAKAAELFAEVRSHPAAGDDLRTEAASAIARLSVRGGDGPPAASTRRGPERS